MLVYGKLFRFDFWVLVIALMGCGMSCVLGVCYWFCVLRLMMFGLDELEVVAGICLLAMFVV